MQTQEQGEAVAIFDHSFDEEIQSEEDFQTISIHQLNE